MLQLRTDKLLSPFIANISEDETCTMGPVPKYNYVPNYTGYGFGKRWLLADTINT